MRNHRGGALLESNNKKNLWKKLRTGTESELVLGNMPAAANCNVALK